MTAPAALLFAVVTLGVIAFQVALALGAPWGAYAMGGVFPGRYPPAMRVAALVQAGVLAGLAWVVLSTGGVVDPSVARSAPWSIWLVVVLAGAAVLLNAASRSAGERRLWVPVALVLLATSLVVATATA